MKCIKVAEFPREMDKANSPIELEPMLKELEQKRGIHLDIPFVPFAYHYWIEHRKVDGSWKEGWYTGGGTYGENTPYGARSAETAQEALSGLLKYILKRMKESIDSQQKSLAFNKNAMMKLITNPLAFKER